MAQNIIKLKVAKKVNKAKCTDRLKMSKVSITIDITLRYTTIFDLYYFLKNCSMRI